MFEFEILPHLSIESERRIEVERPGGVTDSTLAGRTMDKLVIEGGRPLEGEVSVSGAKNAALPLMAATLLAPGRHILRNVPRLADVSTMSRLLKNMGAEVERSEAAGSQVLTIQVPDSLDPVAPYDLVKTMRASVVVLGPLIARVGRAHVSLPGGCAIGARPIDQHIKGLTKLGARIEIEHGYVEANAKRLAGATIIFDLVTVTGTENLIMAAARATGRTVLQNVAREPEVEELARYLNKMGARISGAGSEVVTIDGVDELKPVDHDILPDRIEAGTFLVSAALTGGDVLLRGARPEHLEAVIGKLRAAGASIEVGPDGLRCRGPKVIRPVDISTAPHPGFPTDMQAQFVALLSVAEGSSIVTETVFENRFMHVLELNRMGANIVVDGHTAFVKGVPTLSGAPVMATDLRASACLVLAGLRARGRTEVHRVYHLDRGYDQLDAKLRALGADVSRVKA
jgi:UDP-N-acetylglucosamine 1-carboxyvinyltransferase